MYWCWSNRTTANDSIKSLNVHYVVLCICHRQPNRVLHAIWMFRLLFISFFLSSMYLLGRQFPKSFRFENNRQIYLSYVGLMKHILHVYEPMHRVVTDSDNGLSLIRRHIIKQTVADVLSIWSSWAYISVIWIQIQSPPSRNFICKSNSQPSSIDLD